jgi:hypothetical protein
LIYTPPSAINWPITPSPLKGSKPREELKCCSLMGAAFVAHQPR